jgi:outer membrane protein TolC
MARAFSPAYRAAQQKVQEATARVQENQLGGRPTLSLNGNASVTRGNFPDPIATNNFYSYQGQLTLALPNGAKVSASTRAARTQLRVAQLEVQRSNQDIAFRSLDAYYGILRNRDAVQIAQTNQVQADLQVDDTRKRIAAGDLPESEVLKAQVPELQAEAALARAKNAEIQARQAFNNLIGAPLGDFVKVAETGTDLSYEIPEDQATATVLANSPDVLEAVANVENAQANLSVAKRANDPSFSLQATQTHTSDPTTYTNLGSLGATITIPLIDNGVVKQQIKESQAQFQQANSALALAKQTATLAAQSAIVDLKSARSDYSTSQEVLRIAQLSSDKAKQAYAAGLTTTRDVLDAQIALAQARVDANNTKYALALAIAKLKQILGVSQF